MKNYLIKLLPINQSSTYIFCYHRVIPQELAQYQMVHRALYVTPVTFDKHIRWMRQQGEIVSHTNIFTKNKKLKFVITFDDGWKDNFTFAYPILKKYNAPATVFITTDNIDTGRLFWSEEIGFQIQSSKKSIEHIKNILRNEIRLILKYREVKVKIYFLEESNDISYLLDRLIECIKHVPSSIRDNVMRSVIRSLYLNLEVDPESIPKNMLLSWDDIRIMAQAGVKFGSHTHTHIFLDRVSRERANYELRLSKDILEERLGKGIDSFSYPNGLYKGQHIQSSIAENGYKYAFTLDQFPESFSNPLTIPRILLYEENSRSIEKLILKKMTKAILMKVSNIFNSRMS